MNTDAIDKLLEETDAGAFRLLHEFVYKLADAQAEIGRKDRELSMADHYTHDQKKIIEQMREALEWALTESRSTHGENLIKAALDAAKGNK